MLFEITEKTMKKLARIGVVVGRFQVAALHKGHLHLLRHAMRSSDTLLVVLGSPEFPTPRNPLSFEMRKQMIEEAFPDAIVVELRDTPKDADWIKKLDSLIRAVGAERDVTLYGSRDSFLSVYAGAFRTELVPELPGFSGTAERAKCMTSKRTSAAYRAGVIHGFVSRLKVTRPMVDIAVMKRREGLVLLGGKPKDPKGLWRFPGGLVDPSDPSLEYAARREASEELSNIEIDDVAYIGSTSTNDRRYRGTGEYAITALCIATYIYGAARAGDDLSRVEWFPVAMLPKVLVPEHRKLGEMLTNYLSRA